MTYFDVLGMMEGACQGKLDDRAAHGPLFFPAALKDVCEASPLARGLHHQGFDESARMRSLAAAAIFTCTLSSIAHAGPETIFDLSAATHADQDSTLASVKPLSASEMDSLLTLPDFVQPSTTVSPLDQADHPMIPLPSSFWVSLILLGGVAIYVVKHSRVPNFR